MRRVFLDELPLPRRVRFGAVLTVAASVMALAVSVRLTLTKFGIDYECEPSGCLGGDASSACDEALTSAWSLFLGLPWSLWSAAVAVVVGALACSLLVRRGSFAHAAPTGLGLSALLAAGVSGALAVHALTSFQHLCLYCVALYTASGVWLLGAGLVGVGSRGRVRRDQRALGLLKAAVLFVVLLSAQSMVYGYKSWRASCPTPPPPPPTSLHLGEEHPRAVVAFIVDPSCAECRKQAHMLIESQKRLRSLGAELRLFLFPRDLCAPQLLPQEEFVDPGGRDQTHGDARNNHACLAAQAALCVGRLAPELGASFLDELFRLHYSEPPYFTTEKILRAMAGLDGAPSGAALRACLDEVGPLEELTTHQRFELQWLERRPGGAGLPHGWVIPVEENVLLLDAATDVRHAEKVFQVLQEGGGMSRVYP